MSETKYQEKVLEVEPYGIEPIPAKERHGKPRQMFTIWFAINLNVVTWFTGFLGIEFGLSLKWAILAILIGNLTGAAFLALSSTLGSVTGQPLIPSSKRAFGKTGVFVLSLFNLVNNIGWLAVNLVLAVMAIQQIMPLSYHASLLLLTAVTLLIAVYGYNFIHAFAHWMSIIMGVLFVVMTVITVKNLPAVLAHSRVAAVGFNWPMFILTIAVVFSFMISYCPIGTDYARYLPEKTSQKKVWQYSFWGAVSVSIWLEILGALTATLGMNASPMEFFAELMGVFTVPALITVIISILPVNAMAVYSAGLATLAMGISMKRWASAILTAGLGALLVFFGHGELAETYKNFLLLLSYWIVPSLGVILSDFYYYQAHPERRQTSNCWTGIFSFLFSVAVSVPFMSSVLYVGPVAGKYLGGADISYFLSLVISVVVYLGIVKMKEASLAVKSSVEAGNG